MANRTCDWSRQPLKIEQSCRGAHRTRNKRKKAPDAVCRTGANPGSTAAALKALARRVTVA